MTTPHPFPDPNQSGGECVRDGRMEEFLRRELCTRKLVRVGAYSGGGCISKVQSYETDTGKVFLKQHSDPKAKLMFDGELASLQAIHRTCTVRVPKPIKVLEGPGNVWMLAMEHVEMSSLNKYQAKLGEKLARLHLHNASLKDEGGSHVGEGGGKEGAGYVDMFGFDCTTCCGFIPMPNDWCRDWVEFYTRQRLQAQFDLIEKEYGDREVRELWPKLQRKIPSFFTGVIVEPALLHGDLWSGNAADSNGEPVVYDPASFYGHHEFDLAIAGMFGGFTGKFYDAYHSHIPKAPGFAARHKLYTLFHYLNHWTHFGIGYKQQSTAIMRDLLQS